MGKVSPYGQYGFVFGHEHVFGDWGCAFGDN